MTQKYTWGEPGQAEGSVTSGRLATEVLAAVSDLDGYAMQSWRDASLAELLATGVVGGALAATTFSGDVAILDGFGLVIGHTAIIATAGHTNEFQMQGTGAFDSSATFNRWSANTSSAKVVFFKSRATSVGGSATAIVTGDNLGEIVAYGDDGTDFDTPSSAIVFDTEGTIAAGQVPGQLRLQTAAAGTLTTAVTVDSSQNVTMASDHTVSGVVINETVTTLADDGTPTVVASNLFKTGGTTAITDFDNGVVGQTIKIISAHAITVTDGAAIILNGSANFVMAAADTLTLTMFDDQVWQEVGRMVNL